MDNITTLKLEMEIDALKKNVEKLKQKKLSNNNDIEALELRIKKTEILIEGKKRKLSEIKKGVKI